MKINQMTREQLTRKLAEAVISCPGSRYERHLYQRLVALEAAEEVECREWEKINEELEADLYDD